MKLSVMVSLVVSVILASSAAGQGRLGVDFTPKLIPIVEGIYAYEGPLALPGEEEVVRTNSLVVVTEEGVVVVDGQDNVEEAERMMEAIREVTSRPIRYLINASPHPDHVNGNSVFAAEGAIIIAHEAARQAMVATAANASGAPAVPLPGIVYSDRMTLHVGGKTLELHFFGPAHTAGDTIVYIPEDRVAFLTEVYFNGMFTSLGDGFGESHVEVLKEVAKLDAEWLIPGHGYIDGQTKAQLRAGLDSYTRNVELVVASVRRHVEAGDSLEATLAAIDEDLGSYAELPFYGFLKGRTVEATYNALREGRRE